MTRNEHIASLGFRLSKTNNLDRVEALLKATGLETIASPTNTVWDESEYLVAGTTAGGIAACVGWNRAPEDIVIHSLAVAPSSRGSGIGASMLAEAMAELIDEDPVDRIFLCTRAARSFFAPFGYSAIAFDELSKHVREHPSFIGCQSECTAMVRRYHPVTRGLDQRAFRLIHNTTTDATVPPGAVFLFKQSGSILESHYRGGPVQRGHLIGSIQGNELNFLWQHAIENGDLMRGDGRIFVDELGDGRRELRERLSGGAQNPGELLLREV
ncbi:MAG: GNAT family N-acetyltransferase [Myxococcota bacterium]